ncbi:MAG: DUF2497 domain-containing protein [Thermaurantiacus sp.]
MAKAPLDPNLSEILKSIRETVGAAMPDRAGGDHAAEIPAEPPPLAPPPSPAVQRTVEDVLAELAAPHVKSWVDANLPEIVQRMVAEEVERLLRPK